MDHTSIATVVRLAWHDFRHEVRMSACLVLALAAVLAPLLVLFGLKFGMIDTMTKRMLENPATRLMVNQGAGILPEATLAEFRKWPGVAFVIGSVRGLASSFRTVTAEVGELSATGIDIVPTGVGDPLLGGGRVPQGDDEAAVTDSLAAKLGIQLGHTITGMVNRGNGNKSEETSLRLRVVTIIPEIHLPEDSIIVDLALLEKIEDYRDGYKVEGFVGEGITPRPTVRQYSKFRLYTKTIHDVIQVRERLQAKGISTYDEAVRIAELEDLDANLSRIFWIVGGISILGFLASLAANLLSTVERKSRDLAIMRQIGITPGGVILFPIAQAALVGILGMGLATTAYLGVAEGLNHVFASTLRREEMFCNLLPLHFAAAASLTFLVVLLSAAWAGIEASRIQPAEAIRER